VAIANHDPLWIAGSRNGRLQYRISRTHPAVRVVGDRLGEMPLLDGLLALIERNVPVERIWLDISEAEGAGAPRLDPDESADLASKIATLLAGVSGDEPAADRLDRMLRHLPVDSTSLRRTVLQLIEART
jgi:hypothetical protein